MKTNTAPEPYTEITLIGSAREVEILVEAARWSGRLVWAKHPQPVAPGDPRMRVSLRLNPSN
ncbi:hypothetical protein [Catellatospora citrea]|uniref:Uncharacterized protein n=1 Tax=Catellatospora citrea TaxID=53366 RepID=A0A8J3KHX7_9ACTN|nr:hypothetical protein [Catellatospora citrea]RKE08174.1 hypothetical protein C8E86_3018 [Catellatospora citrea]GIG03248.1 hypothetical protein Cci01nite_83410 [Catellatospora citrea]